MIFPTGNTNINLNKASFISFSFGRTRVAYPRWILQHNFSAQFFIQPSFWGILKSKDLINPHLAHNVLNYFGPQSFISLLWQVLMGGISTPDRFLTI